MDLVRLAILAASSHNTQPWQFHLEPDAISIHPDLSRRCPAVDPDDHHLHASLGCAAENLLLAAKAQGLKGHLSFDAVASCVRVELEAIPPSPCELFDAMPRRQCCRAEYDGKALSVEQLQLLENSAQGQGVTIRFLTELQAIEQIVEFVAAGNTAQFADAAWAAELKAWIRFNAREAATTGDGLYGPVMGSPDVPRWLGSLFMRLGFSAKTQNRKDARHIRSSAAVAVIHSEVDDIAHWIEAGRCYERFALQATALGLSTAGACRQRSGGSDFAQIAWCSGRTRV